MYCPTARGNCGAFDSLPVPRQNARSLTQVASPSHFQKTSAERGEGKNVGRQGAMYPLRGGRRGGGKDGLWVQPVSNVSQGFFALEKIKRTLSLYVPFKKRTAWTTQSPKGNTMDSASCAVYIKIKNSHMRKIFAQNCICKKIFCTLFAQKIKIRTSTTRAAALGNK
jgi:hypothetical protein